MAHSPSQRVAAVAANVRAEVARRGVKQRAIAEHLGIDQRAVSRRLLGQVEWSVAELLSVAGLLDVEVANLLESAAAEASA